MEEELTKRRCVPCEGGTPPVEQTRADQLLAQLASGWKVTSDGKRLERRFTFPGFPQAIAFIDRMAVLAEEEQHHPDFCLHYKIVDVTLYTHAIGGLSDNDFILAAKIDRL
jgi:4a-hydroxytetrahydrobiopterin dehydratase